MLTLTTPTEPVGPFCYPSPRIKPMNDDISAIAKHAQQVAAAAAQKAAADAQRVTDEAKKIADAIAAVKPALPTLRFVVIIRDVRRPDPPTGTRDDAVSVLLRTLHPRSFVLDKDGGIWEITDFDPEVALSVYDFPNRTRRTAADVAAVVGPGASDAVIKAIASALRRVLR